MAFQVETLFMSNLDRGLDVLELLVHHGDGLPLGAIAERLDLPKSGAHRLLAALVQRGYVRQDPRSQDYALTLRVAALGFELLAASRIPDVCQPVLDRLAAESGELVRLTVAESEGLTWVEEPTLAHDHAGHAQIRREAATPIQCGENWWGTLDLQHALDAGASDFVMLDVMKIGGVTGWMRGAALAEARGIPVSSHLWPELSAQLLCLTPTAHWLEYAEWWNPILREPLVIERGMARASDGAGTGVAWNDKAIERFAA